MSAPIHIREARSADSSGIARVQVDSYRTAYAGILPPPYLAHFTYEEQTQDWRDLLADADHDPLIVAENDAGDIVGYALGRTADDVVGYACELVALHVRRDHQRQGVGRQLIGAMAERLRAAGCNSLMLWVLADNQNARTVYEQLGGQLVGEKRFQIEEFDFDVREVAYGWRDSAALCMPA